MTRRLPAPPPSDPRTPSGPPAGDDREPEDADDEPGSDDGEYDDDDTDPSLLRPDVWPDDRDEPTIPEGLLDPDLDDLPRLDGVGDDGVEDDVDLPDPDEVPLEDDLADLDAPDDTDIPVIPWNFEVRVDGRMVPARADPGAERTLWLKPTAPEGEREVSIAIAGKTLRITVRVIPADQEGVVLGRDVLAGRFLLRP